MKRQKFNIRELIVVIVFLLALLLRASIYIQTLIVFTSALDDTFLFITDMVLFSFMIISILFKKSAAIATIYLIIKTYDGLYHPIQGLREIEGVTSSWASIGSVVSYLICGTMLFLAVIAIIIHEFSKRKILFYKIINGLTLTAIVASGCNIVFTAFDIAINNLSYLFIFEPIFQTVLFLGVHLVAPIAHPVHQTENY